MTPAEKLEWIERQMVDYSMLMVIRGPVISGLLAHFERRVATLRVLTLGRATSDQADEIDSMAEALGWAE